MLFSQAVSDNNRVCSAVSEISTQAALSRYLVIRESNASSFKKLQIMIYCCFGNLERVNIKTASA